MFGEYVEKRLGEAYIFPLAVGFETIAANAWLLLAVSRLKHGIQHRRQLHGGDGGEERVGKERRRGKEGEGNLALTESRCLWYGYRLLKPVCQHCLHGLALKASLAGHARGSGSHSCNGTFWNSYFLRLNILNSTQLLLGVLSLIINVSTNFCLFGTINIAS